MEKIKILMLGKGRFVKNLETNSTVYNFADVERISSKSELVKKFPKIIRNKYDLIITIDPYGYGLTSYIIGALKTTPYIVVLRGWGDLTNVHKNFGSIKFFIIKKISKIVLANSKCIISLSKAIIDNLKKEYPIYTYRVVGGRPFNIEFYKSGTGRYKNNVPVILTVTNLKYRQKFEGVKQIIEVLEEIRKEKKEIKNFRFLIAGGGKYLTELINFAKGYDFVEVLGFRKDVPDLLASADVFVYVSYLDSFGSTIIEAQLAGLPVICNDYGGLPEACGFAGIIVRNRQELKNAIIEVLTNKKLNKKLRRMSKKRMENYNEKIVERYIKVWRDVAGVR